MTTSIDEETFDPLAELCASSGVIAVGEVIAVGAAPPAWSGRVPRYQTVKLAVKEVLRGKPGASIDIAHVVVSGSATAEPGETPQLSRARFAVGARLVVFGERTDDGRWVCLDTEVGARPASEAWIAEVRAACR